MTDSKCDVSETSEDFLHWSSVDGLSQGTRTNILNSDVVVVPYNGFRDYQGPLFPAGTAEFFQYLKANLPSGKEAELAVEDEDFRELSLHFDVVTIATCVVKYAAVPLLVKLLSDWISKRVGSRANSAEVRASLVVVLTDGNESKSIQFSYEGPAATFEATMKSALDKTDAADPSTRNSPRKPTPSTASSADSES
jgi:hypothetical protein